MKQIGGEVDVAEHNLAALDNLQATIVAAVNEGITLAMAHDDTYAYFPAEWGEHDGRDGPRVEDPLTIYFCVALGAGGFTDEPVWKSSLRDMLDRSIEECASEGEWSDGLARIRDGLIALAADIDAAIVRGKKVKNAKPNTIS